MKRRSKFYRIHYIRIAIITETFTSERSDEMQEDRAPNN